MNKPVSILFTIPNFITAGSGQAMLNIIERLNRNRFSPAVCVMRKSGSLDKRVESLNIPFIEAPFTISVRPYHTLLPRAWKSANIFRPYRFTLWHSFHYLDDYTEPIIARLAGAKAWIYTKKNMSWGSRAWGLRSYLAKAIVVVNTSMVNNFFKAQKKVSLIPRGIDTAKFSPGPVDPGLRKSWGFPETMKVVAHVANLVPVKNHIYLLKALTYARENIGIVFAGDFLDSPYGAEVRLFVKKSGLEERVRFLGKINDIPRLLRSVDIFAFCSYHEGLAVAVLEAMACGLPCVVTDMPAMRDIHQDGITGIIVPQDNIEAFAKALDGLAQNSELRLKLGEAARKRILTNFSIEEEVLRHEQLYARLI